MLSINMDDVIKVLNSIKSQLIGFGVVAVLLIAVMIACRKQSKSKKYLIRWQAGLGKGAPLDRSHQGRDFAGMADRKRQYQPQVLRQEEQRERRRK